MQTYTARIESFFDEDTNTISHALHEPHSKEAAIFDPVLDYDAATGRINTRSADALIAYIRTENLHLKYIPAVQVNMRARDLPPKEANGVHCVKIPINA